MTANMKKKIVFILILSLGRLTETIAQTPSAGKNSIMEKMPREAMTTVAGATHTTVQTAIQYFDGLGRPTQTILYRASPDASKDIVASYTEYDGFGRAYKSLLPTPSDVLTGAYQTAPQTLAQSFYGGDTYPYKQSVFENSPLNRVVETFGAGQAWRVEKSTKVTYGAAGNEILEFRMNATGGVDVLGAYAASSLNVQTVISERDFRTNEFKDRLGRVVAKSQELTSGVFAITSYIYDDLNRLRIVIQPEAYKTVSTLPSFTLASTVCKEGMFFYVYDSRGRVAQKQVPGGGIIRYVYDRNDRVVLENDDRDANILSPGTNYYKFTKYDIFGRPIMQGLINNIGTFSQSQLQKDFDDFANVSTNIIYEERGTDLLGYTNRSFPSGYTPAEPSVKLVNYYDDYSWNLDVNYGFDAANSYHIQGLTKGLMTGTLIRNLETNDWYKFINYYDYKSRNIQTHAQSHVGGIDRIEYQYRFNGEVLKMRMTHKKTGLANMVEVYLYDYDHVGRKTSFKHSKDGITQNVAQYQFDGIGRMQSKAIQPSNAVASTQSGTWTNNATWQGGGTPTINDKITINAGHTVTIPAATDVSAGSLFDNGILQNNGTLHLGTVKPSTTTLETIDYSYYIRGLKGINLDASGNLTNKIFSFKLDYESGLNPYFDGNISKQTWKSNLDGKERSYSYSYDGASRILSGAYIGNGAENYSLNSVTYDANGNIKTLSRNGYKSDNSFGLVDNLAYTYQTNSNKIQAVTDNSFDTASFADATGTTDYTYSQDGSLISDVNKGITIEYNYLKLPRRIVKGGTTILYQYDATGKKLKETIGTQVTDYVGNTIYKNNNLYQISHDEGRIVDGQYEYSIHDNLGNVRAIFRDSLGYSKIQQLENFGIWGESLKEINYYRNITNRQNFVFTGHERMENLDIIDAKARIFDPIVPRMWQIDRFSEKYSSFSPYLYSLNNPINVIDPTGNDVYFLIWDSQNYNQGDLESALDTRRREIESSKGYDKKKDHVYTIDISNLGKLKNKITESIADAKKNKYGNTVEVSFFTHAGSDGPMGSSAVTGEYSQSDESGSNADGNQLSLEGWQQIDWNLDPNKNIICSYGCNSTSWASNVSTFKNVRFAAGQDGRTGGTYNLTKWNSVWIPFWYENVYQRSAMGSKVLPMFIYQNGSEVSSPDKNPILVNPSFDIVNQTLKKTIEGPKK
jgi:RHS repeat-associated protein